jgi:prepilin-type N-terminal cleavage/methylation domain-containing protein
MKTSRTPTTPTRSTPPTPQTSQTPGIILQRAPRLPLLARRLAPAGARGFSLLELLVVMAMAAILMAIGMPALFRIGSHYKVRSSALAVEVLAHQARYRSIELGQNVTVVGDQTHRMFYVISGTVPGSFPNGPTDIPATQRIAVWQVPTGVTFTVTAPLIFTSNGSGSGGPVVFSYPHEPSSTVTLATPATGKITVTAPADAPAGT